MFFCSQMPGFSSPYWQAESMFHTRKAISIQFDVTAVPDLVQSLHCCCCDPDIDICVELPSSERVAPKYLKLLKLSCFFNTCRHLLCHHGWP